MAQQMSIEEMIRMIDDVIGGSFELTLWRPDRETYHLIELKSLDLGGAEVGQFDIPVQLREVTSHMEINLPYALDELSFGVVRLIAEKHPAFRAYIEREMKP